MKLGRPNVIEKNNHMFKNNLVGNRYGKLIVTRFLYSNRVHAPNKNSHTDTYWECLCDCGNKVKVLTRMLNSGDVKSCGCLPVGPRPTEKAAFNELYNRYICSSRKRNIEFSLTKEKFKEITKQNCFYCGAEPQHISRKNREFPYHYNGIDPVDNNKGYMNINVVPCCGSCNKMKLEMSVDEFKNRVLAIVNHMNW